MFQNQEMQMPGAIFWICGKLTIIGLILLLIGAIIFWILVDKKGILHEILKWPQQNKYLIIITYFYLICSYFLSILSSAYVFQSPRILELMATCPKQVILASLTIMITVTAMLEYVPYNQKNSLLKNALWALHSVAMGPAFAYFGSHICVKTCLKVTWALILATIISITAPKDTFIEIKSYINSLYSVVTITSILCFLFNPPINTAGMFLLAINLFGGMILYFGVFVTNSQYMLQQVFENDYDPMYTAAVIYLSTLNLYLRIAMYHVVELTNITQDCTT